MCPLVLITGANGFLGHQVLLSFLNHGGYRVRATSRSLDHRLAFEHAYPQFSPVAVFPGTRKLEERNDRCQWSVVKDLTIPAAWDEVLKGVDFVVHTASPFNLSTEDPELHLKPAIQGTTSILKAATKVPSIKHIVITSSVSAAYNFRKKPHETITEADWNPTTPEIAIAKRKPAISYFASKTAAEKAAWEFISAEKPQFTLTTLCPSYIFGPLATPTITSLTASTPINESLQRFYNIFNGSKNPAKSMVETNWFVDVRDVAEAHLRAVTKRDVAAGKRYIVSLSGKPISWHEFASVLKRVMPTEALKLRVCAYEENTNYGERSLAVDGSKLEKELGVKLRSLDQLTKDTLESLLELEGKAETKAKL